MSEAPLRWPPDVALLTGALLERAQLYRFVLSPPEGERWPPVTEGPWAEEAAAAARQWASSIAGDTTSPPALVAHHWNALLEMAETAIDELVHGQPWRLCEAVLVLHAIADEACARCAATWGGPEPAGHAFRGRARELMARTGSLSRIPLDRGRLLPKVRTATSGITHRSLSRYTAARTDGLPAVWNKAPARRRGGHGSQHANILLLPWPLVVHADAFRPVPGSVQRREREPFGLFEYAPSEPVDLELVDRVVGAAVEQADSVDAVVFPESAIDEAQLDDIELVLASHGTPLFIAGIRTSPAGATACRGNAVHLGVLLGGQWWHYRQRKHHRWYLEATQLSQYHLEAVLDPRVRWWEAMDIPERSVQLLELGEGVTLAAVVCEDLARLDGVADLLRSIGPTLVVVLLLDGPQIAARWTARYATVLADDPGSAVLTLTAFGMVGRSLPPGMESSRAVALWKDPACGLREIDLPDRAQAALLTLDVGGATRYAADGRWPANDGSQLILGRVRPVTADGAAPVRTRRSPVACLPPSLSTTELSVLVSWAETLSEAMVVGGGHLGTVLGDLLPGAGWRADVCLDQPGPALAAALDVLAELSVSVAGSAAVSADLALERLRAATTGDPVRRLARRLLRNALESAAG